MTPVQKSKALAARSRAESLVYLLGQPDVDIDLAYSTCALLAWDTMQLRILIKNVEKKHQVNI